MLLLSGKYQLLINPPVTPEEAFEVSFPNSTEGILQQNASILYRFYLIEKELSGRVVAVLNLFIEGEKALSPVRSTFGGLEMLPDLQDEAIQVFLSGIYRFIKEQRINDCRIVNPPDYFFAAKANVVQHAFLKAGFKLSYIDRNYKIIVDKTVFDSRIHLSQQRRLRKCLNAGFTFQEEQSADLTALHDFIKKSRERKNYPMSLPLDRFIGIIGADPSCYKVFSVKTKEGVWAAATVTVRFRSDILYNFYPSDSAGYLNFSPSVLLHAGLYSYCQQENIRILDLGIATDRGEENTGLMVFKQRLGAFVDQKCVFSL